MRIGVDFGGTKIEAAALDRDGVLRVRQRVPNPGAYDAAVAAVGDLVAKVEQAAGGAGASVGVGIPGSISPRTGLIRNGNSTWLNGRPFRQDLEARLGRPVRLENDANCFVLSEAPEQAGARVVFGVILGTGCGGGLVVDGRIVEGVNGVGGEWGHTPLPWPAAEEYPGPRCWCGRLGCMELWVSGKGFEADYRRAGGEALHADAIVDRARAGEDRARKALDRYVDRLGRGLAVVADVCDPDVFVLGGGMSNVEELYAEVPPVLARNLFSDVCLTRVVKARHGDSSGVIGAARLWPEG
ncbi:MAG TPA: ROK family protein [Caulobacteraceae bacterium]|jgi:fructokinase|nr:ROK family protein [Caulobacteraceae bacterium]